MKIDDKDVAATYQERTEVPLDRVGLDAAELPPLLDPNLVPRRYWLPRVGVAPSLGLEQAIVSRVSCRFFDRTVPLTVLQLSRLIAFSCGFTVHFEGQFGIGYHRAAPSPGARFPIELYPIVLNVEGLSSGAYHYLGKDHSLTLLRPGYFHHALATWTLGQPWVSNAGVVFAFTGAFDRIRGRYEQRGYRYMLLECGHIAQNLYLLGAAYSLGVLAIGGFVDTAVNRLLGLDPAQEFPLYLVAVGVPI
jgi:SagB-type dehydrogenase family enzyme